MFTDIKKKYCYYVLIIRLCLIKLGKLMCIYKLVHNDEIMWILFVMLSSFDLNAVIEKSIWILKKHEDELLDVDNYTHLL